MRRCAGFRPDAARWQTIVVIGLLAFAETYGHVIGDGRCFDKICGAQFAKWVGCVIAAHEGLAAGLIGFAGAIIAAWLAYSGVQDQLRNANAQLCAAEKLRVEEHLDEGAKNIRTLNAARNYLTSFARRFPELKQPNFNDHFAQTLSQLHQRAQVPLGTRIHLGLRKPCVLIDSFQEGLRSRMVQKNGGWPKFNCGVRGIVVAGGQVFPGDAATIEATVELCTPLPAL
jgi:hypothetical protein